MAKVLVSGASGFIGSHLVRSLHADGHDVVRLVRVGRSPSRSGATAAVPWDPEAGEIDAGALARVAPDVVINLAGEPIAQRWTSTSRRRIRDSRVRGTEALSRALAGLPRRPRVLVSGSAMGYYGAHRGDEILDEGSAPGGSDDFLARCALEWEGATMPARDAGIRVALSRTGLVLGRDGGVLAKLLTPFSLGVGGPQGDGEQWMSWIGLDDMVRGLRFLAETDGVEGAFNLAAQEPVRNRDFARALGHVLHRPAVIPTPAFALRLAFGVMADNTILASQRMIPKRLAGAGFEFRHPRLDEALAFELTRSGDRADR